jgi:hypothetical protein
MMRWRWSLFAAAWTWPTSSVSGLLYLRIRKRRRFVHNQVLFRRTIRVKAILRDRLATVDGSPAT